MSSSAATELGLSERVLLGLSRRAIDLEQEIGRGATSIIYRAADRRHTRCVAVKVLNPARLGPNQTASCARSGSRPDYSIRTSCRSTNRARSMELRST